MLGNRGLRGWIGIALVGALAIGVLAISPAVGGGPFNLKKAKGLFFTKTQSDSRYAAAGSSYSKSESDGRYLSRNGETVITFQGSDWRDNGSGGNVTFTNIAYASQVHSTGGSGGSYTIPLEVPAEIAGVPQRLI